MLNQTTDNMKTMKINDETSLLLHEHSQMYDVKINNKTKEVTYHSSEFNPIKREDIQKVVDKLMRLGMITLSPNDVTEVSINIWVIDNTEKLFIETYHKNPDLPDNELFDDYDSVMEYEDFLNE